MKKKTTTAIMHLKEKIQNALGYMHTHKTESSIEYAKICEKNLYFQVDIEENEDYSNWLRKYLEILDHLKRTRIFFQSLKKRYCNHENFGAIKNSEGKLSTSLPECLRFWGNYCTKLYEKSPSKFFVYNQVNGNELEIDRPITYAEFVSVLPKLKNNKAPGSDFITNEDFKILLQPSDDEDISRNNALFLKNIFDILKTFWVKEKVPCQLKNVILRPFLKNSDKDEYNPRNYRTISLLNTLFKIYEAIIHKRLVNWLETKKLLSPTQAAYRHLRSTVDHIFVLQELFLEYRFNKFSKNGNLLKMALYWCFMDLKKAFDKIPRELLFRKLYNLRIRGKI